MLVRPMLRAAAKRARLFSAAAPEVKKIALYDTTLRDGEQVLEQHKYMECRFVQLTFSGSMELSGFTLTAWKTHYPWYDEDSHFSSSNATLNAVWELCRYTLDGASLDTYTDSNTRERRP